MVDVTALPAKNGQRSSHAAAKVARIALDGRRSLGRVLDVGCGEGNLLWAARTSAVSLTGADIDPSYLEVARERLPEARLMAGDICRDLPLEDEAFDTIFFCDVIEHLANPFQALGSLRRMLAPDGVVVVTTPNAGGAMRAVTGNAWFGLDDESHILFFTRFTLNHALVKAGYGIRRSGTYNATPLEALNRVLEASGFGGSLLVVARKKPR